MADWTKSMQQFFEYYLVDPGTWKDIEPLRNIKSSTINRDSTSETLGSASIDIVGDLGECYIRIYLITIQNGFREKHPLGTFLVQTPSVSFNGRVSNISLDAYTPLLELKEKKPPLGYSILQKEKANILDRAYDIVSDNLRAPVVKPKCSETLQDNFVANVDETWVTFVEDLIANADYELDIDEIGRILFKPKQDAESMQPVWTFNDDNSSILLPEITIDRDLYGIPNVVEVIYSNGNKFYYKKVENKDENSPVSIQNRGREIIHRVTNPNITGMPSELQIQRYAENLLKELSTLEYTISYSHGYCPVRLGDCVRLNYKRAGIEGVKAKVISQSIECDTGCKVTEKAIFTNKLWR